MNDLQGDAYWVDKARGRIEQLTMPYWALGTLCDFMVEIVRIQRTETPSMEPSLVMVFAADHGIADERVSNYPRDVTTQMVDNFLRGGAAISVLTRLQSMPFYVVDMGTRAEPKQTNSPQYRRVRIQPGSNNFLQGPALSADVARRAMDAGREQVEQLCAKHTPKTLLIGEMGIGNTTAAAAISALSLGCSAVEVVGRGTGIDDRTLDHKIHVVQQVVQKYSGDADDPLKTLQNVGGLEIAGMVGALLEASRRRLMVLLDGFVVASAAIIACRMQPQVREVLVASHCSAEPGHRLLLEDLKLFPMLDLKLRLGEASGAALAWPLFQSAISIYREMATFDEAHVAGELPIDDASK